MAIGFKTVKAALALTPKPAFGFTSAANPQVLPQPKPRAVREHFVVPSIRGRDGACAQRSRVGHREHSLKAFDVGNLFGSPFRPNIRHERGNRQGGAASACRDCENVLHRAGVSVS